MKTLLSASCVVVAIFSLAAAPCQSADGKAGIWGRTIMPQPFDKQPFRQIKVPRWVEETVGCGYTLSVMDGKARAAAAAHGVTISEMGFVDPFYAYYDSQLLKKRSPHVPPERLLKDIAEYKRLGVRILGVYPPVPARRGLRERIPNGGGSRRTRPRFRRST